MPKFCYNDETHTYTLDGKVLPNVTDILDSAGIVDKRWFTPESAWRGKCVHKACKLLDQGKLDWDTVDPAIAGYVRSWQAFKQQTGFKVKVCERPAYHEFWKYAGTVDRIGTMNNSMVLIDIKTGPVATWVRLQTAAYAHLHESMGLLPRYGLELRNSPFGQMRYKLTGPWLDPGDMGTFTSCLAVHNWKQRNT